MQKISTNIFIVASVCFGLVGVVGVATGSFGPGQPDEVEPNATMLRLLFACVFVILPSFALSVAAKYLKN